MTLTNGIIRCVLLYLESCKSHAPPSITVQSGLTEGKIQVALEFITVIFKSYSFHDNPHFITKENNKFTLHKFYVFRNGNVLAVFTNWSD